ncbi:MAG: dephospho-CoA kinase [Candidatus Fimisoma sp.]
MTMKIIGLTGGIGTGKSTVSDYLKKNGCMIIDADEISRKMTAKGAPALAVIKKTFGDRYVSADGELDRKALGDLVFGDSEKLGILQSIITEKVIDETKCRLKTLSDTKYDGIIVLDAPLLYECNMDDIADENWLVKSDNEVRIERVAARDNLTRDQIMARIDNQMSQREKEKRSDFIIDNSGTLDELYEQIDSLLERIRDEI